MTRLPAGCKTDASEVFIKKLDDVIARYWLLKHPYYLLFLHQAYLNFLNL